MRAAVEGVILAPTADGPGGDEDERRRLELLEARDRALAALKELEFDHRTGTVSDEDYRSQVGVLRRDVATALQALERDSEEGRPGDGRN